MIERVRKMGAILVTALFTAGLLLLKNRLKRLAFKQ